MSRRQGIVITLVGLLALVFCITATLVVANVGDVEGGTGIAHLVDPILIPMGLISFVVMVVGMVWTVIASFAKGIRP